MMKYLDTDDPTGRRLFCDAGEAIRCLSIYRSAVARERPMSAWLALPFGLSVQETLTKLATEPKAPDPEGYRRNFAVLEQRFHDAVSKWKAYQQTGAERSVH